MIPSRWDLGLLEALNFQLTSQHERVIRREEKLIKIFVFLPITKVMPTTGGCRDTCLYVGLVLYVSLVVSTFVTDWFLERSQRYSLFVFVSNTIYIYADTPLWDCAAASHAYGTHLQGI